MTPEPIRMVFFDAGWDSAYADAVVEGARDRARRLHVELEIVAAQADPAQQVQQMRDGITSGKYIGGFVLPIAPDLLCDLGTNVAPDNNFMLVVTATPLCDREQGEGEDTWAPGTLAFVSAGHEISNFTHWGEYIRARNPGRQKVVLLVGPETSGASRNADAALRAIAAAHPEFEIVATLPTDFSQQSTVGRLTEALNAHPGTTIVASIHSEVTEAAASFLKDRGHGVRVYDVGAASPVLALVDSGDVQMTVPSYPRSMGATAVQALFDARIGRTPIPRFYADSGHPRPALQGDKPLLFVTHKSLAQFKADALSEY